MKLNFDMDIWIKNYNECMRIGAEIKQRLINKEKFEDLSDLISQTDDLRMRTDRYLDNCKIKKLKRLWRYDAKDLATQASSPDFAYDHLI